MSSDSLQAACELAYAVARNEADSTPAVEPPASMRSFLYVEDLPRRAITVAQQAIEADSDFRQRVAAKADEGGVGRAGYLWLKRPAGWAQEFERLTEDADDDSGDDYSGGAAPEPDPELEQVYNDLLSSPVEVVTAQAPEPDFKFDPADSFTPSTPPIGDASLGDGALASIRPIGGSDEIRPSSTPSFESSSLGIAAVTDSADDSSADDDTAAPGRFASFEKSTPSVDLDDDFDSDALENELSSLRGLVDRLANERKSVSTGSAAPTTSTSTSTSTSTTTSGTSSSTSSTSDEPEPLLSAALAAPDSDLRALEVDLESATHELSIAREDLDISRREREEARRQHSSALKRQVELEKEVATIRDERMKSESQLSEAQASVISLEDKVKRLQSQLDDIEREHNVTRSQLEVMTTERNQAREDRIAIKTERDELMSQVVEVEEKSGGVDVGELSAANKSLTTELETTSRELARMIAQAESFEEQIKTTTALADGLRAEKVELTSRLGDAELALETTTTQHDALKTDSERLASEVGTLRAERDGLQSQLTELQASLADVLDEQVETRHRNDTDRRTLNELRVERDVLMAKNNDLEQADREYETRINALMRERDDLVSARDDLINERGQLRGEAAASSAEKDQLLEKLRVVEGRIAPMETELQAERRQREELANRLLELDAIAERNAAELTRLTEERESLSSKLDELQVERVEAAEVRVESENLQAQLDEANRRMAEESDRSHKRLAETADKLAAAETAKTSMEQQLAELRGELDGLKSEHEEQNRELARLRLAEESANVAVSDATTEIDGVRTSLGEANVSLNAVRLELDAANAELASTRAELQAKTAEVEALSSARGVAGLAAAPPTVDSGTTIVSDAPPADIPTPAPEPVAVPPTPIAVPEDNGDDAFDWPPPQNVVAPPAAEADEDIDLLTEAGLQKPASASDEDDLDEVSALISQTVSGFAAGEPVVPGLDGAADDVVLPGPGLEAGSASASAGSPPSLLDAADTAGSALVGDQTTQLSTPPTDPVANPGGDPLPGRKRRKIDIPGDILEDEVAVAQFVVSSPDVVLLVDGDSVAKLGWPSLPVAQQRDALVTYLADLSASSGAAPDVVFDGRIGDDQSLPASRAVRIRLSTPPTEPAAALDELVDAYPEQWPIALVTDDENLGASAGERGAVVLNNGQLLDLFIAE
jgi:SMC interacting uncharacterized protein involved in chromosome segregation